MRRFISFLASLTRFATLAVVLMLACLAPQAEALLTSSHPALSSPILSQAHAPESVLIIEEIHPLGYADDGECLDLCICVEPETLTRVFYIVKSPTGLAIHDVTEPSPWLPSGYTPYKYGDTLIDDYLVASSYNLLSVFNNTLYGVFNGAVNIPKAMEVNINDPMAPYLALPGAAPLVSAAVETYAFALAGRAWLGVRASSAGMKLTKLFSRSKGAAPMLDDAVRLIDDVVPDRFDGTIYRSPYPGTGPKVIDKYNIAANHRYSAVDEGALYFSSNRRTVVKELGGKLAKGRSIHSFDVKIDNLLDLSNPSIRSKLGVSLDDLIRTSGDEIYSVTQDLGRYARDQGLKGIIAPSARADGGLNIILFQSP